MFRRFQCLCMIACAVSVLTLTGCQTPARQTTALQPSSVATLQLASWGSQAEHALLQDLLAAFHAKHPHIRVTLLHIPDNYYQKLHLLAAAGLLPDVVLINSQQFPAYAQYGLFQNVADTLSLSDAKDFFPTALKAFDCQSKATSHPCLGAFPRDVSVVGVYVNTSLLARLGIKLPTNRWTWADWHALAAQVAQQHPANANRASQHVFGASFYRAPVLFWLPWVYSNGGKLFTASETPKNITALQRGLSAYTQWLSPLASGHLTQAPYRRGVGNTTMTQLFLEGRLATLLNGPWIVPVLRKQATFHWTVLPFPRKDTTQTAGRVGVDATGYAISAKTQHPKAARLLAQYLTRPEALAALSSSGLIIPARQRIANSPAFQGNTPSSQAVARVFLNAVANGVPTEHSPHWAEASDCLTEALNPLWDEMEAGLPAPTQTILKNALLPCLPEVAP